MKKRKISLGRQHRLCRGGNNLVNLKAVTENALHQIDKRSVNPTYIEVPESTVRVLYGDSDPEGKIVFVYRPEKGLPQERKFFSDHHTEKDVGRAPKIPGVAKLWISEFLWGTGCFPSAKVGHTGTES